MTDNCPLHFTQRQSCVSDLALLCINNTVKLSPGAFFFNETGNNTDNSLSLNYKNRTLGLK